MLRGAALLLDKDKVIGDNRSSICGLHTNGFAICACQEEPGEAEIMAGRQGGRLRDL